MLFRSSPKCSKTDSIPTALESVLEHFGDDICPGDVFILNDPFQGGMHIPDIFVVKPIFDGDQRVAFAVATAHHLDLGGRVPGSSACDNTEIFQDGLRIPWLKLYDKGKLRQPILDIIRANVRVPDMTIADLRAQLAACHTGEQAIFRIIERYGTETFINCARDLIDYTDKADESFQRFAAAGMHLVRSTESPSSWPDS